MDYRKHYERLIKRARGRVLTGYVEVHHVLPRCMGGTDDVMNLVQLTPEEHYTSHQLLCKIYPGVVGLTAAVICMTADAYGWRKNKLYGWLRRRHALNASSCMTEKWQDASYRESQKAGMDRLRESPEYVEKIRNAISTRHKGRVKSPEEIAKFVASKTGMKYKKMSAESRANMAAARRKTWAERKANGTDKLAAAKTREKRIKNGSYKKTDAQRAAISVAQKGRVISPEHRAKISKRMKAYRASIKAQELGAYLPLVT